MNSLPRAVLISLARTSFEEVPVHLRRLASDFMPAKSIDHAIVDLRKTLEILELIKTQMKKGLQ